MELSAAAAAKMRRVEGSLRDLADKEQQLRLLVEASEAQVRVLNCSMMQVWLWNSSCKMAVVAVIGSSRLASSTS